MLIALYFTLFSFSCVTPVPYQNILRDNIRTLEQHNLVQGNLIAPPLKKESADVLLIKKPGIQFQGSEFEYYLERSLNKLKMGGYLFCDNKHDTAELALENRELILVGGVSKDGFSRLKIGDGFTDEEGKEREIDDFDLVVFRKRVSN